MSTRFYKSTRFYVFKEKLVGGKGWTVRNHNGQIVYHYKKRLDADHACSRLNAADTRFRVPIWPQHEPAA